MAYLLITHGVWYLYSIQYCYLSVWNPKCDHLVFSNQFSCEKISFCFSTYMTVRFFCENFVYHNRKSTQSFDTRDRAVCGAKDFLRNHRKWFRVKAARAYLSVRLKINPSTLLLLPSTPLPPPHSPSLGGLTKIPTIRKLSQES